MTFLLAIALAQAGSALPPPPADWDALPSLSLTRQSSVSPNDTFGIMRIVEQRPGCRAGVGPIPVPREAGNVASMEGLRVRFAILVAPNGRILNILASRGACEEVRNYSRAIVNARYRGRIRAPGGTTPAWYGMSLGFSWEP